METKNIEEILWLAIKDIEDGTAKTELEDPANGLLPLNNKLTKRNISYQSAKYNSGKPISRPTIDSYKSICEYLDSKHESLDNYKDRIKELETKNKELYEQVKESELFAQKTLNENVRLNELLRQYSVKSIR